MTFNEDNGKFVTLRRPKLTATRPDETILFKLLLDGLEGAFTKTQEFNRQRWLMNKKAKRLLGEDVAKALSDADYVVARYEDAKRYVKMREEHDKAEREKVMEQFKADKIAAVEGSLLAEICKAFDVDWVNRPPSNLEWRLRKMIRKAAPKRAREVLLDDLKQYRDGLEMALRRADSRIKNLTPDSPK
jgi:hypothetical protein